MVSELELSHIDRHRPTALVPCVPPLCPVCALSALCCNPFALSLFLVPLQRVSSSRWRCPSSASQHPRAGIRYALCPQYPGVPQYGSPTSHELVRPGVMPHHGGRCRLCAAQARCRTAKCSAIQPDTTVLYCADGVGPLLHAPVCLCVLVHTGTCAVSAVCQTARCGSADGRAT